MNKKEIKLAMRSALSAKLADEQLVVVDSFDFEAPRTKDAVKCIEALGVANKRITLVLTESDLQTALSFRNLPQVTVLFDREVDTYFLLDNNVLVMAQPVAERLGKDLA
jgi:large subunit ribosomal protein L4